MPKGQMIMPTTPREYTLERLQELRHQADLAGDTATRDALSDKIHKIGGKVPSRGIPDNETKIGRFERLRQDALDVNDLETADKLAELIAGEQEEPVVGTEEQAFDEPRRTSIHVEPDVQDAQDAPESDDPRRIPQHPPMTCPGTQDAPETLTTAPESDLNALEGPEATVSVNDGTASVNATAKIKRMGFQLEDIPAKDGGKVTVYDVNAYANMLAEV